MEAQRFPDDFDAIIAGAPGLQHGAPQRVAGRAAGGHAERPGAPRAARQGQALFAERGGGRVRPAGRRQGRHRQRAAGVQVRSRPCWRARPATAADCLTPPQVENARSAYAPVTAKAARSVYPGRSPGFEAGWRIPTPGAPLNPLFTDMVRYVGRQDPNWDPMTFDLRSRSRAGAEERRLHRSQRSRPREVQGARRQAAAVSRLGRSGSGAGEHDQLLRRGERRSLAGKQDDWMRLFLMPGVGHCGGGVGPDQADFLGALERWREAGEAPARITRHAVPAAATGRRCRGRCVRIRRWRATPVQGAPTMRRTLRASLRDGHRARPSAAGGRVAIAGSRAHHSFGAEYRLEPARHRHRRRDQDRVDQSPQLPVPRRHRRRRPR